MAYQIKVAGLPEPEREFMFAKPRRWRFDFAWPERMIAVECEGGTYTYGRHQRPSGFIGDCIKYNEAALRGWVVLRFPSPHITSGAALETLERALNGGKE